MRLQLDIETHDPRLGFDIAATGNTLKAGTVVEIPGGASIEYQGSLARKSVGIPEVLHFLVDAAKTVDLSLLAAWLYDKVKEKEVERIVLNRRVITEITKDGIRQVLEEEFKSEH